jgi:SH3 domain protein
MQKLHIVFFLCLFVIFHQPQRTTAAPESEQGVGYISDFLVINIRDNLERPFSVIEVVHSGDKLKIIDRKGEYLYVETEDGNLGWISSKYVKYDIPKPIIIAQLKEQIATLQSQLNSKALSPGEEIAGVCNELQIQVEQAHDNIALLEEELLKSNEPTTSFTAGETSSGQSKIDNLQEKLKKAKEQYRLLAEDHVKRGEKIAELQNIVTKQNDKSKYYWFAAGSLVFFIGLLAGKSGNRKKSKFMY